MTIPSSPPKFVGDPNGYCRHAFGGAACIPKRCILDYACYRCGYDQWIEHLTQALPGSGRVGDADGEGQLRAIEPNWRHVAA